MTEKMQAKPLARAIYYGSNGGATRSFLCRLAKQGQLGRIAAQLFRAQKASSRAKAYRGGIRRSDGSRYSYRRLAYDRKAECLETLCDLLEDDACGMRWGWGEDLAQTFAKHVLYIDLPLGQVSFHSEGRYVGPDYDGEWDGDRASEERVIEFCDLIISERVGGPS